MLLGYIHRRYAKISFHFETSSLFTFLASYKRIAYNGWGISKVPDRKGGNLDEASAKSDMLLLSDPSNSEGEERSDEELRPQKSLEWHMFIS